MSDDSPPTEHVVSEKPYSPFIKWGRGLEVAPWEILPHFLDKGGQEETPEFSDTL